MVDSKTVVSQVQELQVILHEIHAEGMMLSETFQVAAIIEKLPPAWKDFKNYLKHKRKGMSIEDLVIRLRIEEDNRGSEKKMAHNPNEAKANFVEHGQSSKIKKGNNKGKDTKLGPKGGVFKKQKFLGKCFNSGKQGHKSSDYRLPKWNKPKEANMVDDISKDVSDIDLTVVISEVNWWDPIPRNGGLTLVLLAMCALIRRCSPPLNQLRLGKRCSWGTLPLQKLKAKEKWC